MKYISTPGIFKRTVSSLILAASVFVVAAFAQTNVDTSFSAVPSKAFPTGTSINQIVQPDGKVIVYGPRMVAGGVARGDIIRLNVDGSVDSSFNYCGCGIAAINNLVMTPDGKIFVGGGDPGWARIIRLNADGSVDPTFSVGRAGNEQSIGSSTFTVNAIGPDGKVYALNRYSLAGNVGYTLYRYGVNGVQDSGFSPLSVEFGSPAFASVVIEPLTDGRFYMAVTTGVTGQSGSLRRRLFDGSVDPTWEIPSFSWTGFPSRTSIGDIAVGADGSVYVAGRWDSVNGLDRKNVVKLFPAGNVDMTFTGPNVIWGTKLEFLPDGKLLYSANTDIANVFKLFRLNADGGVDGTYVQDPAVINIRNSWGIDSLQRTVFYASTTTGERFVRLNSSGSLDGAYSPSVELYGTLNALARQMDGKVLVAGVFTQMNGVARSNFARVNADGSLDTSFDVGTGFNAPPENLVQQSDGKIIAAGGFNTYNGTAVPGIVRLNTNGSIDNTFAVSTNGSIYNAVPQSDGKIYIVGTFGTVNSQTRTGVARLNADGSLDTAFNATIGSPSIRQVLVQSDGKVVIGGSFSGVNGFNRANFARLNADGSLDQTFLASVGSVSVLTQQADGKLLIGVGTPATLIDRRNTDGSDDTSFVPPTFSASSSSDTAISAINVRNDGSIVVGGRFNSVGTFARNHLIRLTSNGSVDLLFPTSGANAYVRSIVSDGADKIVVGGDYSSVFNSPRAGIARLALAPYRAKTNFDFDGDGRADVSVFRPSEGRWYILQSADLTLKQVNFAIAGDIPAPADFDGDGKTDVAIYRPSNGDWWSLSSATGQQINGSFAQTGAIPVPADISGDGRADYVVYRPATGQWHRVISSNGQMSNRNFGAAGDKPVIGDFNGDGLVDCAIYRPSDGNWWWLSSADGVQRATKWGLADDNAVAADYTGDGKTDFGIYRPSTGVWYIYDLANNQSIIYPFGTNGDRPVSADYDGDGRADTSVFRPSNGIWYLLRSTSGYTGYQWGIATDTAVPASLNP